MSDDHLRTSLPRRILVVEDEADSAQALVLLLRRFGHEPLHAPRAEDALELARTFKPHVVLLDLGLPGMGGYELAARLQQETALGVVRLIAVTGYDSDEHRAGSRAVGCEQHLVKPIEAEVLFRALESPPAK